MVALDATILLLLLSANVAPPTDPSGKPVEFWKERIDFPIQELEKNREKIIIPTPALSEILVHADRAGPEYLNRIKQSSAFKIEPFDDRAAVEVAMMIREDKKNFSDKRGEVQAIWAKVKFDRQIVAIAKVNGASVLYSDDGHVRTFGERAGLTVIGTPQLPLPQKQAQGEMFETGTLEPPKEPTENGD
jgi:predicted nucleic acid-binding protein